MTNQYHNGVETVP